MDLPKRKPMRLPQYDYSGNGAYFITVCTKNRRNILCDIVGDDAHIVPKKCGVITEKYIRNIPQVTKYVIMPNHIHLIITLEGGTMWASSPTKSVSDIIRSLKILVSKEIGEPIFQRSFYDHVIRNEQDYLDICEYVENNPAKWKEDRFYTT